jgi:hypothetical protein
MVFSGPTRTFYQFNMKISVYFYSKGLWKTNVAQFQKEGGYMRSGVKIENKLKIKRLILATSKSHRQDYPYGGLDHLKPCDMMYFQVINFTSTSDVLSVHSSAIGRHDALTIKNYFKVLPTYKL